MNVLIIEDELKAAKELEKIILSLEDVSIRIIDSVEESLNYLSNDPPIDLIFSDIQLADGICFDIYKSIDIKSPIIFCTAFDEYMMEAFETNAVSYILKPVSIDKVDAALQKFRQMKKVFEPTEVSRVIEALSGQLKYPYKTALLVNQREKIIPVEVKQMAFLYLEEINVKITMLNGQEYFVTFSLDKLEKMLDPEMFYRANRQFLISRQAITNVERFFSRKLVAQLHVPTPENVVVSKAKASDFLRWLEGV